MKQVNFILLLLCIWGLVGCDTENFDNDFQTTKIQANINDKESRTSVNSSHQILWNEGDKISVFGSDAENREFTLSSGSGQTSAVFEGKVGENKVAFYPYDAANSYDVTTQSISFVLPDEITYKSETIYSFPMAGTFVDGTDNVSFKNIGALLSVTMVNIPSNYTYIKLLSDDEPIAGNAKVTFVNGIPQMEIENDESASKSVTINFEASTTSVTKTFHFTLPVGDYSNLTIQAGIFEGATGTATVKSAALNVERNGHYELTYYSEGSYAVKSDGSLIPASNIPDNLTETEKEDYIAVAIIDSENRFMLAKSTVQGSWGSTTQTVCKNQYNNGNGSSDKAGKENTDKGILSEVNLESSGIGKQLVSYRENSIFKDWYIPSAGQAYWQIIMNNKSAINYVLAKIGTTIQTSNYWTSTEYGKDMAWYITDSGNLSYNYKSISSYKVWFIRDF